MLLQQALVVLLSAAFAVATPIYKRDSGFNFGSTGVYGVNLGGWLVLEPWITPSIFEPLPDSIVDEYTLCAEVSNAADILQQHWASWVSLADLQKIAGAGFNTVRVPVGYWAYQTLPGDPYVQGAAAYVDQAIDWARQTGLQVWIDLHGAPLSQNGYDNSGQRLATPGWSTDDSIAVTLSGLGQISSKYATDAYSDVVAGIELLNEPLIAALAGGMDAVSDYYRAGYELVRETSSSTGVIIHDGFENPSEWNGFLTPSDNSSQRVIVDHHYYQVFTNQGVALQPWAHRQGVCNDASTWATGEDKWLVCGEWTGAMTDCAKWLNGRGTGARFDGTLPGSSYIGDCGMYLDITQWDQTFQNDVRGFIEAQLDVFAQYTQGFIFWNFKTENTCAPEWDLFALLDGGMFPQPLSDRRYGSICAF